MHISCGFFLLSDQRFHHEAVHAASYSSPLIPALINTSRISMLNEWSGFSVRLQTVEQSLCFHAQRHRHSPCLSQIFAQVTPMKLTWYLVIFTPSGSFFFRYQKYAELLQTDSSAGRRKRKLQHLRRASYRFFQGSVLFTSSYCAADALNAKTKPASASKSFS